MLNINAKKKKNLRKIYKDKKYLKNLLDILTFSWLNEDQYNIHISKSIVYQYIFLINFYYTCL